MGNLEKEGGASGEVLLFLAGFLKIIFWLFVIVSFSRLFLFQFFFVDGQSMEPTFHDKELLVAEKVSYYLSEPRRYEMVIFHPPYAPKETLMKRILGLPSEKVQIKDGAIFVFNDSYPKGLKLEEPYRQNTFAERRIIEVELGPDEYFVVGDNNLHSFDSRGFGAIDSHAIIGRIFLRLFPLGQAGMF